MPFFVQARKKGKEFFNSPKVAETVLEMVPVVC
jgi:hypothetical protein